MTDDESVAASEDTGLSEEAQASTEEDLDELSFDDLLGDEEDEDEAATESEESEAEDESQDNTEQSEVEEESQEDAEAERKRHNAEMAQQRIAEKEAREAARKAQEALEATHIQNYLAEAQDDAEELAQRQLNVEAYKLQQKEAELNQQALEVKLEKAMTDIDLFRTGSEPVKQRLLRAIDQFEQLYVVKDNNGRPVEVKGDIYQHLVNEANSIRELTQIGAVQEAKSKDQAKARTITPPTRAPKEPKVDPDLEDFDKVFA